MWATFSIVLLIAVVMLYAPGFLFFRGLGFARTASVAIAPAYTLCLCELLAMALSALDIPCSGPILVVAAATVALAVFAARLLASRKRGGKPQRQDTFARLDTKADAALLFGYVLFGLAVAAYAFLSQLDDAASVIERYDNCWHLGLVRSFLETGCYSTLSTTLYPVGEGTSPWISTSAGYYPALWHLLVASVVSLTGCPLAIGVNAVVVLTTAIVFPLGIWLLLRTALVGKKVAIAGIFVSAGFAAFPWGFVLFGSLLPNILALALLPSTLALLIEAFSPNIKTYGRVALCIAFFLGVAAAAMAHPNSAFTLGVIALPFLLRWASKVPPPERLSSSRTKGRLFHVLLVAAGLAVAAIAWVLIYKAPFMQGVVSYNWEAFASKGQALANLALTQLTPQSAPQVVLSIFIFLGALRCCIERQHLWMLGSLLLAAAIHFICSCVSPENELRHLVTGFWYTDVYRIAAMYVLAAIPLASMGAAGAYGIAAKLAQTHYPRIARRSLVAAGSLIAIAFAFANFCPSYTIYAGNSIDYAGGSDNVEMTAAFDMVRIRIDESSDNVYSETEQEFIKQVKAVVGDELVINDPYDGSAFLYGTDGINVFYRKFKPYGMDENTETAESKTMRTALNRYKADADASAAVKLIGAHYVLLLDTAESVASSQGESSTRGNWEASSDRSYWKGLYNITEDTPGFELVLSEGDMRLYKITG